MNAMKGKRIIVGVSGGIAAYKAIEIVSRLRKLGAEVKVVMTENATHIASPLTFGEISNHPVAIDMWQEIHDWNVEHISLATWADAYIIAPATANIIGKIANGIADDMLSTTVMATTAQVYLCPAMNTNMYENPITQRNIETLKDLGYLFMEPASGMLACGVEGVGRLPEPCDIVSWLTFHMCGSDELKGKTVLVTAGGTQEAIDPVRYIGNRSSGKMGYAIAGELARRGAHTILVSAPTHLPVPEGVQLVPVDSAQSMEKAVHSYFDAVDAVIMAAAVSDFRVEKVGEQKIKKMETMELKLVKNPDILKGLGQIKDHQKLIGFAAETEKLLEYAYEKVQKKNLDFIVANDVSKKDAGFNVDTNEVTFIYKDGHTKDIPNQSKQGIAKKIVDELVSLF